MAYSVRTPKTIGTHVRRSKPSLRAALREATNVAKMFGGAVVEDAKGPLAHCHLARGGDSYVSSPRTRKTGKAFAHCLVTARGKKILKRKRRR
jgi:hypothetical protein